MNNTLEYFAPKAVKKSYAWVYKLVLFLSFVWIDFYVVSMTGMSNFLSGAGNLFSASGNNFATILGITLIEALFDWAIFEICMWVYRTILSFRIYSFIVPATQQKNECRIFFAIKNLFLGIIINLCFFFPYLYNVVELFNFLFLMIMLLVFAYHIQKKYSEPIISHFVFKCFCLPVFVYECLVLIYYVLEVLL